MAEEQADQTGMKVLSPLSLGNLDVGGVVATAAGHVTKTKQRCYQERLNEEGNLLN